MSDSSEFRKDIAEPLTTRHFFNDLPPAPSFDEAIDSQYDQPLPSDWWIVVTDIVNSTDAITQGRYKDVNTVGGAVIMAAINLDRSIEIPYIFGGDGATLAIPPELEVPMRRALLATKELASNRFDLSLRTIMVPVRDLEVRRKKVHVAKYQQSPHMRCAMLVGDGWILADTWAKDGHDQYVSDDLGELKPEASYEGFECRWQSVPSRRDHKLSLLIGSAYDGHELEGPALRQVMAILRENFGDLQDFHPLTISDLRLSLNPLRLTNEAKIRLEDHRVWAVFKYLIKVLCLNLIGRFLFRFMVKTSQVDWGAYKPDFVSNADFFKFDGTLKMVLDSTVEQTDRLETALEKLYQSGEIVYGLHRSPAAILTCLVFSYSRNHAHFVDGDGGGYALAARALKQRRRQKATRAA